MVEKISKAMGEEKTHTALRVISSDAPGTDATFAQSLDSELYGLELFSKLNKQSLQGQLDFMAALGLPLLHHLFTSDLQQQLRIFASFENSSMKMKEFSSTFSARALGKSTTAVANNGIESIQSSTSGWTWATTGQSGVSDGSGDMEDYGSRGFGLARLGIHFGTRLGLTAWVSLARHLRTWRKRQQLKIRTCERANVSRKGSMMFISVASLCGRMLSGL